MRIGHFVRDAPQLDSDSYRIELFGAHHGGATLYPDRTLAIRGDKANEEPKGAATTDPAFGLPAVWIDDAERDRAAASGYTLVDPVTVLITHLGQLLKREMPLLLSRNHVVELLEEVRNRQPGLIEELIPNLMTVSDVQQVLRNLLAENVSIRNIDQIAEALVDVGRQTKDPAELTELVRTRIAHTICHRLRGDGEALSVISLAPRLEAKIGAAVQRNDASTGFIIDPSIAETLLRKLAGETENMLSSGLSPVLLCGPEIRRQLQAFIRRTVPKLHVISVNEVPVSVTLQSFALISEND
ncbi:FHIPEP family type III secretion protein [uncultured Parasphingopyxis sp.]|mgnify:CR=1 FL=1|uniref:FHIPEP family type III secretion protein n=1 Tax=uncultured Parasphingopyxis sp. TaxID=1547918 RepID=UPI00262AE0A4|nr:FHIPEP family type III secretion protein [uncultured Parasphingopyxis sp.]